MTSETNHRSGPAEPKREPGDGLAAVAIVLLTIVLLALLISQIV